MQLMPTRNEAVTRAVLILEMNHPLEGIIRISSAPLRKAVELIGQ
jgi:hypothetical protein